MKVGEYTFLPKTCLMLRDAHTKLAGLHFSQETLTVGEREILYLAEALLRLIDDVKDK